MKILNIITGGVKAEGITSVWLSYCREIKSSGLSNKLVLHFGVIDQISDYEYAKNIEELGFKLVRLPNRQNNPLKYIISLSKVLREGQYDAIHANGSSSFMLLEMFAAVIVKNVKIRAAHSHNTVCNNTLLHKLCWMPFQLLCNRRYACGEKAGKWLFGDRKFTVLSNGKDLSLFKYSASRRKEMRDKLYLHGKFVIGHVGTFTEQKNHKFLIKIFKEILIRIPNAHLYLIGDGPLFSDVKSDIEINNLSNKVTLTGVVNDIPDRLQAMDLMLFPSLYEGLPNVVIEWQAVGLPCVISDVITKECGTCDLVAYLSLNEEPSIWADTILSQKIVHTDRVADANKGIESLRLNGFDISDCVNKFLKSYTSI